MRMHVEDGLRSDEVIELELKASVRAFRSSRHLTGDDIKYARKALGWTRSELARRCGTAYTTEHVIAWETDKETLPVLAKACMLVALECELAMLVSV